MDVIWVAVHEDISLLTSSNMNEKDYFGDPIVYRTNDEWGDIIVIDRRNRRVLAFDPVYEQSCMDLKNPHIPIHDYSRIMLLVLAFIDPQHVIFLGLGGGCLLQALHYLNPRCKLFSIELREKVYEVAVNYFLLPVHHNIKVSISDAKLGIRHCEDSSTQIIFADMYKSYGMDQFQMAQVFIKQCHRVLDDTGWLVVNYHHMPELNYSFIQCLQRKFVELFVCQTSSGNTILFASKSTLPLINKYQPNVFELERKLNIKLSQFFRQIRRIHTEPLVTV